jgi:hypothetical protein
MIFTSTPEMQSRSRQRERQSIRLPAAQVDIRVHPGLDHLAAGRDQKVQDACFDWLLS